MKDMTFKTEEDGKTIEWEIISYVKNPSNNKAYIIYHRPNDNEVYASVYRIEKGELILDEITNDDEWDFLEKELDKLEEKDV